MNTNNGNCNNNNKNNINTNNRVRAFRAYDVKYRIPLEDFFDAYFECRKHKRNTVNAAAFEVDYINNLTELWEEVNEYRYEIGKSICFIVKYPKLREVFAADFRDRIIHHLLISKLEPLFENEFIVDSYSCRKGKGTLYGVTKLYDKINKFTNNYEKDCYVGKFDLKSFFMSIHKKTLWLKLEGFIKEKYKGDDINLVLWLCEKIVMHCPQYNCIRKGDVMLWNKLGPEKSLFTCGDEYGLPIGNLTSQIFANFYLNSFDHEMIRLFGENYGRYVDDFYVIAKTKEEITSAVPFMKRYLQETLKLKINTDKTYIQPYWMGIKFIGSVVKKDRIYIGNSTRGNMSRKINKFNNEPQKMLIVDEFISTMNSYLGFLKHCNSYNIKYEELMRHISPEWWRYVYATNHLDSFVIRKTVKDARDNSVFKEQD